MDVSSLTLWLKKQSVVWRRLDSYVFLAVIRVWHFLEALFDKSKMKGELASSLHVDILMTQRKW